MGLEQKRTPNAAAAEEIARANGPRTIPTAFPCKRCQEPVLWHFTGTHWQMLGRNGNPHHCVAPTTQVPPPPTFGTPRKPPRPWS